MLETAGQGWAESQPPGLFPLAGGGTTPGNGAHPQLHSGALGEARRNHPTTVCVVKAWHQASPPKGRKLPV